MFPMAATDMIVAAMFGGGPLIGQAGDTEPSADISDEERREAESHMSGLFNR